MWKVRFENKRAESDAQKLIRSGELTKADQAIIHSWIQQVSHHGPDSIRGDFKWADHPLSGEWDGYRASAFSNRGRIIYRIEDQKISILISRITTQHDYRKGKRNEK